MNNLKQVSLGLHNLNDTFKELPPLCSLNGTTALGASAPAVPEFYEGHIAFTVFDWLLPFVEQESLYDASYVGSVHSIHALVEGDTVYQHVIPAYNCPSDPTPSNPSYKGATTHGGANLWATGNYAVNYLVLGKPTASDTNRRREEGRARIPDTFLDGTSNVIVFAERYATCGSSGNPNSTTTWANLWSDSWTGWRAIFCINNSAKEPTSAGYIPCQPPQGNVNWITQCDPIRTQSGHPGGLLVGMGDGSVRYARSTVSSTVWQNACDPRDGVSANTNL